MHVAITSIDTADANSAKINRIQLSDFVPDAVEKRKALSEYARRVWWIGCNILLDKIPVQGRITIVKDGIVLDRTDVLNQVKLAQKIKIENIADRGWLMDVSHCVNAIASDVFTLDEIYLFEKELAAKHPNNHNI